MSKVSSKMKITEYSTEPRVKYKSIPAAIIKEIENAFLIQTKNYNQSSVQEWIPLSAVRVIHRISELHCLIEISEWILRKKGIIE